MKLRFVRLICLAALWLPFTPANTGPPYHHLTMDDFQGFPQQGMQGVIAYTNCSIEFSYTPHRENGYFLLDFNIGVTMNNDKSWMDKRRITTTEMLNEVLKHEQGHYTIAYLEQQELLRAVSKTVFHADYQAQAKNIFNRIDAKYKQLNYDYDEDTQHMLNKAQQHSWDMYFKKRLEFAPPAEG